MDYQAQVMKIIAVPLLGSLLIPVLGWMGRKKLTGYLAVALIARLFPMIVSTPGWSTT